MEENNTPKRSLRDLLPKGEAKRSAPPEYGRPIGQGTRFKPRRFPWKLYGGIVVLIIILAGGYAVSKALATATITVVPRQQKLSVDANVTAVRNSTSVVSSSTPLIFDVITICTATRDAFLRSREFKVVSTPEFVSGEGLCLPAGAKIDLDDIVFATGGGASNAAVTFSRQGFHTATVCKIGNDVSGREILSNLKSEGVSTGLVVEDEKLKTAYSVLILSNTGERTVLVYRGASENFETDNINPRTLSAKWFYIAGALPLDVLNVVLTAAKDKNAKVAINPSYNQIKLGLKGLGHILKKVNVVIMNREEGALLTGVDYKREEKIFSILDEYIDGIVVLTDGPKGVLVSAGHKIYQAGIYKEKIVADRTGAGDAFGSGFVAGLMDQLPAASHDLPIIIKERDITHAIKLASANATSVVESVGAKTGILSKDIFENESRWKELDIKVR